MKVGWVFFYFFGGGGTDRAGLGGGCIPRPVHPCQLQRTGRADRDGAERWRAWSVSETEQICTHSSMNDFQHKNVCKTIDINTRMCYYIDNTRTCYTTTKQEDKNHETRI